MAQAERQDGRREAKSAAAAGLSTAAREELTRRLQHEYRAEEELFRLRAAAEWIAVAQRELEQNAEPADQPAQTVIACAHHPVGLTMWL